MVYQRPRWSALKERITVNRQVEKWLNDGNIRPSNLYCPSPVVVVPKKDGTSRLCISYRQLIKKIIKDYCYYKRYSFLLIEDQLDKLQGATVLKTLDLKNGFFYVPVDESDIKYTAFVTPDRHFEILKTSFWLYIAPPVFQYFINYMLRNTYKYIWTIWLSMQILWKKILSNWT